LVTANYNSSNVSILVGNGNGTFATAVNFPAGSNSVSVALGDFNGDGKSDLAVPTDNNNRVSILLNTGQVCNAQSAITISGRVSDAANKPLKDVPVTLTGPVSRVVSSDAAGNYSFPNLTPGGNYVVTAQSTYFVFAPSRVDFFNLTGNQANFV